MIFYKTAWQVIETLIRLLELSIEMLKKTIE